MLICFTGILNAASVHYITVSLQFSSVMIKNGPYVSSVLVLISVDLRRFPCCLPWTMRRWRRTWSKAETDSSPCFFKRCVGCVFMFLPPYFLYFLYLQVVWANYFFRDSLVHFLENKETRCFKLTSTMICWSVTVLNRWDHTAAALSASWFRFTVGRKSLNSNSICYMYFKK